MFFLKLIAILLPLTILVMWYISFLQRSIKREKIDPEYAAKLEKFRAKVRPFIPPKKAREAISTLLVIAGFIWWLLYNPD